MLTLAIAHRRQVPLPVAVDRRRCPLPLPISVSASFFTCEDGSMWSGAWEWEHEDVSMGMGAWRWDSEAFFWLSFVIFF